MDPTSRPTKKNPSGSRWGMLAAVSLCVLVPGSILYRLLSSQPTKPVATSVPDLTRCTRIKIGCHSSPMEGEEGLLTPAEVNDLGSLREIIVEDKARIMAVAEAIKQGSLVDGPGARIAMKPPYDIVGYRGDQAVISIPVYGPDCIVTSEGYLFRYSKGQLFDPLICVPKIRALVWRRECAAYIRNLYYVLRRVSQGDYPQAGEWCDVIMRAAGDTPMRGEIARFLRCPSAREGKCHYAMNPQCTYSSPGDTVLLFETKAGWNQHGGAELFTFDNHDPKGGLVLLNDGTVKFIRTEEELKQLRWK